MEVVVFGLMVFGGLFGTGFVTVEPVNKYIYTVEVHKEVLKQGVQEYKQNNG